MLPMSQQVMSGKYSGRLDERMFEKLTFDASNPHSDVKMRLQRILSFVHLLSQSGCLTIYGVGASYITSKTQKRE